MSERPRVVILRGHHANVGELRPWELLLDRFDVEVVTTARADQGLEGLRVPWRTVATRRARLPRGRLGTLATHAVGDAYTDIESLVRGAAIVHTAELGPWFAVQPARAAASTRLPPRRDRVGDDPVPLHVSHRAGRGQPPCRARRDGSLPAHDRPRSSLPPARGRRAGPDPRCRAGNRCRAFRPRGVPGRRMGT